MQKENVKVLLVYPEYPSTFWSYKYALRYFGKKATYPPLGLPTVAAMLPKEWHKKLVDMNTEALTDEDLRWADYVFISAMIVQKKSAHEVIEKCKRCQVKIVAGGPLFTSEPETFAAVDHLVLNEAEVTLPLFLSDLNKGCAKHIYSSPEWPDLSQTPIPSWELIDFRKYASLSIQYSRGCPFDCEFCDVVLLNGNRPRTKSRDQILAELDALYNRGWRGNVLFVDDNFVGNKRKLKTEILPAIIEWMRQKKFPFSFSTQASINLADDEELMRLMAGAGFNSVFVGIESPNEESLIEADKVPNLERDLLASVKKIHNHGMEVTGGFIVGFDSDPPTIFESQIDFIQKSGIVAAMVGLLIAPYGTRLYQRLKKENRIVGDISGDNTDCTTNLIPRMGYKTLLDGYKNMIHNIYSPKPYYERCKVLLTDYKSQRTGAPRLQLIYFTALVKSIWFLGVKGEGRKYYWKLLAWALLRRKSFWHAVYLQFTGDHFRQVAEGYAKMPTLELKP